MKKKTLVILAAIFLISSFSACGDTASSPDDSHSLVNYTDTGESYSSVSSRTADIEHSSEAAESTAASVSEESSDAEVNASKETNLSKSSSSSASSSKTSSTVSNTTNTVIYYYENDDSEIDSSHVSQTSSAEESSVPVSDSDTESQDSTDTDVVSGQEVVDEPVSDGSFTEEDIALYYYGDKIYLRSSVDSVKEILGEPNSIDKTDNRDTYYYNDVSITVVSNGDSDEMFVEEIEIFDSALETEKGIKNRMSLDDVINTYGSSSTVFKDEYRYYVGDEYMYFYVQNGIVANMGYRIDHEVDNESV